MLCFSKSSYDNRGLSESQANAMLRSFVPQPVASWRIRTRATEPRSTSLFWWWAFRCAASQTPCDGCPQKLSPEALVLTEGHSPAVPEPRGATPAQRRRNRQMRARRGAQGLLIALTIFGPVSCGKTDGGRPVYPVRGQVFFKGKPTPGALVLFHPINDPDPQAPRPHGHVDQDGHFTLSTYRADDGAPVGQYVVTIDWQKRIPGHSGGGPSLMPPRYRAPKESPLRATVGADTNNLPPFEIPR